MNILENPPFISIIIPVKNAEKFIVRSLTSLNNLNYPKDKYEVIISDSDSTDKTRTLAISLGAKVIIAAGMSVCAGRNSGFKVAKGEIIAFSDADCVMDKDWLLNSLKYFQDEKVACVGGPSLIPDDETAFGKACGFIFSYRLFTGGSTYGLNLKQVKEVRHNPGCNAIYRRSALEKVMPVEEKIIEGEDVWMNKKLIELGYKFLYTPDTRIWHYRSSTVKRFWRQNFRYAIGRVILGRKDKELINPLHIIAGLSLPIILIIIALLGKINLILLFIFISFTISFIVFFSFFGLLKTRSLRVALNIPLAIILLMTAWSLGFMKGLLRANKK